MGVLPQLRSADQAPTLELSGPTLGKASDAACGPPDGHVKMHAAAHFAFPVMTLLAWSLSAAAALSLGMERRRVLLFPAVANVAMHPNAAGATGSEPLVSEDRSIVDLPNGCRYSTVSAGTGETPAKGSLVAVRLRGLLMDGSVFLDTAKSVPILFRVGSVVGSLRPDGPVTPAIDVAVSRMRGGEIGRLVSPSEAGYGRGMSMADTRRAGLQTLFVPSGETLRYEIELLRCLDVTVGEAPPGAVACCPEAEYPCELKTGVRWAGVTFGRRGGACPRARRRGCCRRSPACRGRFA